MARMPEGWTSYRKKRYIGRGSTPQEFTYYRDPSGRSWSSQRAGRIWRGKDPFRSPVSKVFRVGVPAAIATLTAGAFGHGPLAQTAGSGSVSIWSG